jgi:hypothetical protein
MSSSSQQPQKGFGVGRTTQDLIVTAFGIVTSSITALILALVETKVGFAFYSFMWWFVIPVGALLSGFAGASGYYLGARLFHHRPTRLLLFNMISVAITTYFLLNWLNYSFMEVEGHRVSELVPFGRYLDIVLSHQTMAINIRGATLGESGELGGFGYVLAVLQVLGFAVGGLGVYFYLRAAPYCEACSKYLEKQSSTERYTSLAEQLEELYAVLADHLKQGDSAAARNLLSDFGNPRHNGQNLKVELTLWRCRTCPQEFFESSVNQWNGKDWKQISGLHLRNYLPRGAPAPPGSTGP